MRIALLAFSAAVLVIPFAAAQAQSAPPPSGYDQGPPPGHQGLHRLLTREQTIIWRDETKAQTSGMTPDQRRAFFQQQMQQIEAMPPDQQAKFRDGLQARWNALSPDQQQALEQRIAEHHERWEERRQGAPGQPPEGQPPEGQPPQDGNE